MAGLQPVGPMAQAAEARRPDGRVLGLQAQTMVDSRARFLHAAVVLRPGGSSARTRGRKAVSCVVARAAP